MNTVVLNGTSSSGKTSIVKSLQKSSEIPVLHASLDTFTDMFDWSSVPKEKRKECHSIGVSNFHTFLKTLRDKEILLVVDHVFEQIEWLKECFMSLQSRNILFVGVHCPLDILEERERSRRDRRIGLAKTQFNIVHKDKEYDLEFDTSVTNSEQCASRILKQVLTNRCAQFRGLHSLHVKA